LEQLASSIDDGDFAAGANSRVETQDAFRSSRRSQQQLTQVAAENLDRFGFCGFPQLRQQFGADMQVRLKAPGPLTNLCEPFVGGAPALFNTEMRFDHRHARMRYGSFKFLAETQFNLQYPEVFPTQHRQRAVRRYGPDSF